MNTANVTIDGGETLDFKLENFLDNWLGLTTTVTQNHGEYNE
jgi:hypothetical protein